MVRVELLLPESFDDAMRRASPEIRDEEIDDWARRGYIAGMIQAWLDRNGEFAIAVEMRLLNDPTEES